MGKALDHERFMLELIIGFHGYSIIEAQDRGDFVVFKIKKHKAIHAPERKIPENRFK